MRYLAITMLVAASACGSSTTSRGTAAETYTQRTAAESASTNAEPTAEEAR